MNDADFVVATKWAEMIIPSHLDKDELIANAWGNAADAPNVKAQIMVFQETVRMYIDQDCSSF